MLLNTKQLGEIIIPVEYGHTQPTAKFQARLEVLGVAHNPKKQFVAANLMGPVTTMNAFLSHLSSRGDRIETIFRKGYNQHYVSPERVATGYSSFTTPVPSIGQVNTIVVAKPVFDPTTTTEYGYFLAPPEDKWDDAWQQYSHMRLVAALEAVVKVGILPSWSEYLWAMGRKYGKLVFNGTTEFNAGISLWSIQIDNGEWWQNQIVAGVQSNQLIIAK